MAREIKESRRVSKRKLNNVRQAILILVVLVILYVCGRGILYLFDYISEL
jgi:hypothetical protein